MYLPIVHTGSTIKALVVCGGADTTPHVRRLLEADAAVTIIAPACHPELMQIIERFGVLFYAREARTADLEGHNLLLVGQSSSSTEALVERALRMGLPTQVLDRPARSTAFLPTTLEEEGVVLAISAVGAAPFLEREMAASARRWLQRGWSLRARWAGTFRDFVRYHVGEQARREALYDRFMRTPDLQLSLWDREDPPLELWASWVAEEEGER
jgi:uroporphyrin-III C-methyltransferase/precorrin-2 dehydrogenase/sirohydrochlorin ferrochelatase